MVSATNYWNGRPFQTLSQSNGTVLYHHQDGLGTERALTGYRGTVTGQSQSYAFGETEDESGYGNATLFRFGGTEEDRETNTAHAQFRQYHPTQGRWLSPDPYDGSYNAGAPQSFNRYAYVQNNPLAFNDPSGLILVCDAQYAQTSVTLEGEGPDFQTTFAGWNCYDNGVTPGVIFGTPGISSFGDGVGGSGAPSNQVPPNQKSCGGIIATGVIQTGLDALGAIPGEAVVSLTAKGALAGSQVLAGYASTAISVVGGSKAGVGLGATGSTLTLLSLATDGIKGTAELIPWYRSRCSRRFFGL